MREELRARIIAFNKTAAERKEKAGDLNIIIAAFAKLPPGQLKKVLTDDLIAVLNKHGANIE